MSTLDTLLESLSTLVSKYDAMLTLFNNEITVEVDKAHLQTFCIALRDSPTLLFEQLVDIAGIDYQTYGCAEWTTETATHSGFDRGVSPMPYKSSSVGKPRFAAVYHLLSLTHNHRLRLKVFANTKEPASTDALQLDSVTTIWESANWYEREAFDLYGIEFQGHPDLRRLLTDYNFEGHPFRKDFPLIGKTEVRYDKIAGKVISEPVNSVAARVVIPKVLRQSNDAHTD